MSISTHRSTDEPGPWTQGDGGPIATWIFEPGHTEAEFRARHMMVTWSELAEWTSAEIPGSNWARLLQHQEKHNVFLSFGPWDSAEAIAAWRASPGFEERVGRIRGMLEDFEPGIFESRAEIGTS